MAFPQNLKPYLSESFGQIRQPVADRVTTTCVIIANKRLKMLDDAQQNDGFIKDKHGNFLHLDAVRYKDDIAELTRLFDTIPFSDKLFNQGGALSRRASHKLKANPDIQNAHQAWPRLNDGEKVKSLADISKLMIDVLNDSEPWLCLNYPQLALARFAPTKTIIAMQVQESCARPYAAGNNDYAPVLTLISVNRDCHSLQNFDDAVTMLWHEHMHMYMSAMREGLNKGFLMRNHPLYKDVQNSKTITDSKITGNVCLAESIYYAEPEEKFCYAAQTVFQNAFSHKSQAMPEAHCG